MSLSRAYLRSDSSTGRKSARLNPVRGAQRLLSPNEQHHLWMTQPDFARPYSGPAFPTSRALASGVTPGRLRSSDLAAPFSGVRIPAHADLDLRELCRAYRQRAGDDEFFSHVTAARLWGVPLPLNLQRRVALDSSVFHPNHPPQTTGVIGHRISHPVPLRTIAGLPVAPPAETWIQLGSVLRGDDLIVATDGFLRRKRKLATLEELHRALADSFRRPGLRSLREALAEARPDTDSPRETLSRLIITRAGLPEPVIHFTVYDQDGFFVGTPDLAYEEYKIAMEYEGDGHRTDDRIFQDDIERAEIFQDATWRYVRITKDHVDNPPRLVERVRKVLIQRGWKP